MAEKKVATPDPKKVQPVNPEAMAGNNPNKHNVFALGDILKAKAQRNKKLLEEI